MSKEIIIIDKILPKLVTHPNQYNTKCIPFWAIVIAGLSISAVSFYFGFIKNTTKLSHHLSETGIALTFIVAIVLLCCLFHKKDPSSQNENEDAKLYKINNERREELIDFNVTTDPEKLTGNDQRDIPRSR